MQSYTSKELNELKSDSGQKRNNGGTVIVEMSGATVLVKKWNTDGGTL